MNKILVFLPLLLVAGCATYNYSGWEDTGSVISLSINRSINVTTNLTINDGNIYVGGGYSNDGISLLGIGENKGSGFFAKDIIIDGTILSVSDLNITGNANITGDLIVLGNIYGEMPNAWKTANQSAREGAYWQLGNQTSREGAYWQTANQTNREGAYFKIENGTALPFSNMQISNITSTTSYLKVNNSLNCTKVCNYNWYKNKAKNATRFPTSGLVLYLPFDGNSTSDYSNNGNSFTSFNGANVTNEGKIREGYAFNKSQYLNVSDQSELSFTGLNPSFAFAFWVNYNGVSGGGTAGTGGGIISKAAGGGQWEYSIEVSASSGGQLILQTWTSGGGSGPFTAFSAGNAPHSIEGWHHGVITADGTNARGYIDGVLKWTVDKVAAQMSDTNEDFVIGVASSPRTNYFNGTIDEVAVFNRDFSASEIMQIYQGTRDGFGVLDSSQLTIGENWIFETTNYNLTAQTPINNSEFTIFNTAQNITLSDNNKIGINKNNPTTALDVFGSIKAISYQSSDGTAGLTGSCASTTTLTVKNGLITACT